MDSHDDPLDTGGTDGSSSNKSNGLAAAWLVGCVVLALAWFWWTTASNPKTPYLTNQGNAQWIVYPMLNGLTSRKPLPLIATFVRSFDLPNLPSVARLQLRAFRSSRIYVNGSEIGRESQNHDWKDVQAKDLTKEVRVGANQLTIEVENDLGPPALWAELQLGDTQIVSDHQWRASLAGATELAAREANDAIIEPAHAETLAPPLSSLTKQWMTLTLFATLAAIGTWVLFRLKVYLDDRTVVLGLFGALAISWILLFWHDRPYLDGNYGFDVGGHLEYITYVQERRHLPLANDGWEMFQPPLYYVTAAAALDLFETTVHSPQGITILRALGLVIGLAHLTALYGCIRLLFPSRFDLQAVALLLAGLLPAQLYIFQYVSNEGLVAAMCSISIYLGLRLLLLSSQSPWWYLLLGLSLGLALLTKLTAVIVVFLLLALLLSKSVTDKRNRTSRIRGSLITFVVVFLVSGWHYGRVWHHFGSPLIANWDPESGFAWWQLPGFQSTGSLFRFGRVFFDPYLVAVYSLWDGIYSTWWGDGGLGGSTEIWSRPPWNFELMSIGYLLAIVPSLLMMLGMIETVVAFVRAPTTVRFLLIGLSCLTILAILQMNVQLPYYSLAKGFFALPASVAFFALAAIGYGRVAKWSHRLRMVTVMGLLTWAFCVYASFWIPSSSPETLRSMATGLLNSDDPGERPTEILTKLLEIDPRDGHAWTLLAVESAKRGDINEATEHLKRALAIDPEDAGAMVGLAILSSGQGQTDTALELARDATALEPDYLSAWALAGQLLRQRHQIDEAIVAYREALRIDPYDAGAHAALGLLFREKGDLQRSFTQLKYAVPLDPENIGLRMDLAFAYASQAKWAEAVLQAEIAFEKARKQNDESLVKIAQQLRQFRLHVLPEKTP